MSAERRFEARTWIARGISHEHNNRMRKNVPVNLLSHLFQCQVLVYSSSSFGQTTRSGANRAFKP
jgi:hypothetical protein